MSSSEGNSTESEESCEESDHPADSTVHADRRKTSSSSESDDSDDEPETNPSSSQNNKTINAVDSSEEDSDQESKSSVKSNQDAKAVRSSHNISSDSDSSDQSSQDNSRKVTSKHSSDEESPEDSDSASSTTSGKKKSDVENNGNESDSSDRDSDSQQKHSSIKDIKVECSSNSSKSKSDDSGSDREASDDDGLSDNAASEQSAPKNIFSFSDENLISYSSGVINVEKISTKNDFWLVHCPKVISDKELQGAEINFTTETRLKIGGRRLQTTIYPDKGSIGCVLPSLERQTYFVVGLPVKGSVVFEESVKLPKPVTPQINLENSVKFPAKLKERHPLFGADYKERLHKISELRRLLKSSKKRKSKGKEISFSGNESIIAPSGTPKVDKEGRSASSYHLNEKHTPEDPPRKERKKSISENSIINGDSSSKHKKRKRDKSESEAALNESLFKVKKRKVDKVEGPADVSLVTKSSKKSTPDNSFLKILQNIKEEVDSSSEFETPKKKKKKSKQSA